MISRSDPEGRYRRYLLRDRLTGSSAQLAGLAALCAASVGVVWLIGLAAGPVGGVVYWSVAGGVGAVYAFAAIADRVRAGGVDTWSKGVANERVARELEQAGELELAGQYFRRALAAFEVRPETDLERDRIRAVRAALDGIELRTADALTVAPRQLHEALHAGDHGRAAAILADWGKALGEEGRWRELEEPLTRLLETAPAPRDAKHAASLAELGEQADGHGRLDLAARLLTAALPPRDEGAVLVGAEIGAVELRRGNLREAAEHAVTALGVHASIGRPWEIEPPYEIAGLGDFRKARELRDGRLGRRLPCPPIAFLLCTMSALYRTVGAPKLAWPCAAGALESVWTFRDEFPRAAELLDWALREIALVGCQAGATPGLVPSSFLARAALRSPWEGFPRPEPLVDLRRAGLALVEGRMGAETAEEMQAATAALGGDDGGGEERWGTWTALREAQALRARGRDTEAVAVCEQWAERAAAEGWVLEECACLDVAGSRPERLRDLLAASPELHLEALRQRREEGVRAHGAGAETEAREALTDYVQSIHALEEELVAAGMRTAIDPTHVSASVALLVDSWSRSADSLWRALEWSERDKRWAMSGNEWRPIETPPLTTWPYPFAVEAAAA